MNHIFDAVTVMGFVLFGLMLIAFFLEELCVDNYTYPYRCYRCDKLTEHTHDPEWLER